MDTNKHLERVKKEAAPLGIRLASTFVGVCVAHFAKKNVPFINSLTGDGISTVGGYGVALAIPAEGKDYTLAHAAKDAFLGVSLYGVISGISRLGAPVTISGIKGLGAINVPQNVKDVINKVVPQLNGMAGLGNARVIEMYADPNTGTYSHVAGLRGNTIQFPTPVADYSSLLGMAV